MFITKQKLLNCIKYLQMAAKKLTNVNPGKYTCIIYKINRKNNTKPRISDQNKQWLTVTCLCSQKMEKIRKMKENKSILKIGRSFESDCLLKYFKIQKNLLINLNTHIYLTVTELVVATVKCGYFFSCAQILQTNE